MGVDHSTASDLAVDLVHVMKKLTALRHHKPAQSDGIESSAYPLLVALQCGPCRVSALAGQIHSDASTVSRQVAHLVSRDLVEKAPDPDDGRAQMVQLTPPGEELVDKVLQRRGEWMQKLLTDWTAKDVKAFNAYLRRFNDDLAAELTRLIDQPTHGKEQS
ncbi:MarR family transcriptional regulator [Calidifontibacter sp. DB0510]|uniref:MarR family transcriptional regulator n=1 Tax=Metallococcus carri TaxID=1656884 RepID=A0A967EAX6_9MICO|nr:MarR family transcriptional regulator [Metallococcus carri]NHN56700.1 MarR family transcriptional regulator [Metallococcus carri]NOP37923.1 MarR family transcriptional regulator [Calidifontibacter sp. DB2511S]